MAVVKNNSLGDGIQLYQRREFREAIKIFNNLSSEETKQSQEVNPLLFYYLGLCYTSIGEYRDALVCVEQVLQSDLSFIYMYQSRMILGYIFAISYQYDRAEKEFRMLVGEGYESAKIRAALAYVYYAQGKVKESLSELQRALVLDSENANAMNSLGYILADIGKNLSDALVYCQKAVRKYPSNTSYLHSLAYVYIKQKNYEQARAVLEKASALSRGQRVPIEQDLRMVKKKLKNQP